MKVILNPNKEIVTKIKEGLERTGGYCPCKLERIEENKCMCEEFRNQIKKIDISENVTVINDNVISSMSNVKNIKIPSTLATPIL